MSTKCIHVLRVLLWHQPIGSQCGRRRETRAVTGVLRRKMSHVIPRYRQAGPVKGSDRENDTKALWKSGEDRLDDISRHVREPEVAPGMAKGEAFVVQSDKM